MSAFILLIFSNARILFSSSRTPWSWSSSTCSDGMSVVASSAVSGVSVPTRVSESASSLYRTAIT
jgi:hypothetical protein